MKNSSIWTIIENILTFADPVLKGIFDKLRFKSPTGFLILTVVIGAAEYVVTQLVKAGTLTLNENGQFAIWLLGFLAVLLTRPVSTSVGSSVQGATKTDEIPVMPLPKVLSRNQFEETNPTILLRTDAEFGEVEKKTPIVGLFHDSHSHDPRELWQRLQNDNGIL